MLTSCQLLPFRPLPPSPYEILLPDKSSGQNHPPARDNSALFPVPCLSPYIIPLQFYHSPPLFAMHIHLSQYKNPDSIAIRISSFHYSLFILDCQIINRNKYRHQNSDSACHGGTHIYRCPVKAFITPAGCKPSNRTGQ